MRRITIIIILLSILTGCGTTKSYVWQQFDSDVRIAADGTLQVTETLTLRFTGGPYTFAFRDLPQRRLDAVSAISVNENDRVFTQVEAEDSKEPFTFSIVRENDLQRVRWVYPATTGGTRTFVLRYTVAGAVRRYPNYDEIWWSLVPANRDQLVVQSRSSITWPTGLPVADLNVSAPDWSGQIERQPGVVAVQAANIPTAAELTLRVQFPKNSVAGAQPAWQPAADEQARYNTFSRPTVNTVLSALAMASLLGMVGLVWFWWRRNRDPQGRGFVGAVSSAAPDDLHPALAAKLLRGSNSSALIATLLDLAKRGYLTMHEGERKIRFQPQPVLARRTTKDATTLAAFEQNVIQAVFGDQTEVDLRERRQNLIKAAGTLGEETHHIIVERGYFDPRALQRRTVAIIVSSIVLGIGVVLLVVGGVLAERYSWWLPVVPGVVVLMALLWLIISRTVHGVTSEGADAVVRWRAFQRYLRQLKPSQTSTGQFDHLLPYATALGVQSKFVKAYSATNEPLPIWFYPAMTGQNSSGGGGETMLLQDWSQNFMASLTSVGDSTSSGDGGSSGGGASGGGGAGAG